MRDVAVIGVGMMKWGELWEKSLRDIYVEAALNAIDDAGVDRVDSLYIGCMSGGLFNGQEHLGSLMADYLGLGPLPAVRVESACASGGLAFRQGWMEVASGISDVVLVGGVEKMTDVGGDEATYALSTAADQTYEGYHGITFPGLYAMIARAYMDQYGATSEQLAAVAVKNHLNGSNNPYAQYPHKVTVEQVVNSVMVADPLHILDCSPITDGAAAVVLCPMSMVSDLTKGKRPTVKITGSGHSTDTIALHARDDLTWFGATERAAAAAFKMAGRKPSDIQVTEVHDCFTIAEIGVTEALGYFERGKGAAAAADGLTAIGGPKPVNPSGGLKSKGHPVGATGVAQIVELVKQLRGECDDRQIAGARLALAQNMGGSGGSTVVHILEGE